ncbi:hypothetical protein [Streptomyces virginiae]|uniref:hypothetical protein n=1 Tax=Streptomyces virginiae TaxID=1961 RepID=UPI00341D74E1
MFGLVLMLPYTELAGGDVPLVVADAARAVRRERVGQGCGHEGHPFDEQWEDLVDTLPDVLLMLADDSTEWWENHSREQWLCPRSVTGFAAMVLEADRAFAVHRDRTPALVVEWPTPRPPCV